ncbi:hypothetical protein K5V21_13890 [Clostridium sardiniense]|uniref:HNH endonuclease n=1 Tax=Clostridium sardiniense TaxID=29369 RepID=A0ABS7L0E8_CLOSR|nr:hypothetical protein [Clostridium sardiniense]MBY0756535.1 hypothetical protein [Clostridium sardiniense]MDQ0460284.1 hypothetical protein [Clostridium sardiniense]
MRICEIEECGSSHLVELHHIVFRGQAPALINCKHNLIPLCYEHHRGTYGVHGSKGHELDMKLKYEFQEKLRMVFGEDIYYTVDEISNRLDIKYKETNRLVKTLLPKEGKYKGEDIIRSCMGGKLVLGGIN